ncbi:hypothetical protein [Paludisphaera mucosa]|uniref:Uncharacterized protein n=1 Tax=Paludisphaera mucosa TaxID=3030827 RepID=A0ABT6FB66_9BACT|nr:hypothetical protein [Paludisphaera mucosa]MDG3004838.1 hypothetical protein [Paludisphaera mucosa]
MKNVMKFGQIDGVLLFPDDAVTRLGTLGIIGGGLLALLALMF